MKFTKPFITHNGSITDSQGNEVASFQIERMAKHVCDFLNSRKYITLQLMDYVNRIKG